LSGSYLIFLLHFIIGGGLLWFTAKEKGKIVGEVIFYFGMIFSG